MRIEYHRTLLADHVRNLAFEEALKALIIPGQTVVADIGAGTGYLGLIAARCGARKVYLYESAEIATVALAVLRKNKARNCELIPFSSRDMDDPPKVDLIVSETLGNYPLEEDIVTTINDARKRHLQPGGKVIPSGIVQYVAPVIDPAFYNELITWRRAAGDIDFSAAEVMSFNNVYVRNVPEIALLGGIGSAREWDRLNFDGQNRTSRKGITRWTLEMAVAIHGFATWWDAELAPGIKLSTAPDAPHTHWEQLFFPIAEPFSGSIGDTVQFSLRSRSSPETGTHLAWTATLEDAQGKVKVRHAHDLDRGYLP